MERNLCKVLVPTSINPSHAFILDHIRLVKWHLKRRREAVFCTSLQSLHVAQFGHPLFWSLSDVHTLFWIMNQAKNLHFGTTQGFQTTERKGEIGWPKNCIL
jgi:hypothetical protein